MKRNILYITCLFLILLGISCSDTIPVSKETSEKPVLFPDYADVTIPYNIDSLKFQDRKSTCGSLRRTQIRRRKDTSQGKRGTILSSRIRLEKIAEKGDRKSDTSKALRKRQRMARLSGILTIRRSGTHGFISGLSLDRTRIRTLESNGYLPTESGRL